MARAALRIEVTTKDRKELRKLLSGGVQQVRVVLRAVALLQLGKGVSAPGIAGMVPLTAQAIRKIGHRYREGGLERALYEKQRPGAEALLEDSEKQRIIAMVCSNPPEGFARRTVRLWWPRKLSEGDWCRAWAGKPSGFCSSATTSSRGGKKGYSGILVGSGHQVQATAMEIDGGDEVRFAAEAARGVLDPLNL
jgi:putative transposase